MPRPHAQQTKLRKVVKTAFSESHDGWSTDYLLCVDDLLRDFDKAVQRLAEAAKLAVTAEEGRRTLLTLRKSGGLGSVTSQQARLNHEDYRHVAETVARRTEDEFGVKIDSILCDPTMRQRFDNYSAEYNLAVPIENIRLAALGLRKSGRLPPLVGVNTNPPSEIFRMTVAEIQADGSKVPRAPGLYVFHAIRRCLYAGETEDLYKRVVRSHCQHSDRKQLAQFLWKANPDDVHVQIRSYEGNPNATKKMFRRALEKELIDSLRPEFNIQGR